MVTGIAGVVLAVFCTMEAVYGKSPINTAILSCAIAYFFLFGLFAFASVLRSRIVLDDEKIQIFGALRRREMRRDDIAGIRLKYEEGTKRIILVPNNPRTRRLAFYDFTVTDDFFEQWLRSLPDLDGGPGGKRDGKR